MRPLRMLLGAVLALVVAATLATPAYAGRQLHRHQTGPAADKMTWSAAGSYVLGDSIAALSTDELQRRRPRWTINALGGRPVTALPALIRNLRAVDQRPYRVVVELGSNQAASWRRSDYADAVALLPTSTRVLLVTPYKAPGGHWARKGVKATERYARWMNQLARRRPHTCVVPWRAQASAHPEWLRDGLHPNEESLGIWADLILSTDASCR
jgi:hypothetical protein